MREITAGSRLLAVIGHPIAHSLSPQIHNRFAAALNLPYVYMAFDIAPHQLREFAGAALLMRIAGFNVTMPLKEAILPCLDTLDEGARRYGAVNTVAVRDGRLCGYNTDGDGFIMSLKNAGFSPRQEKTLILGTGGAARAVAIALAQQEAHVKMASRRADSLAPIHPNISYCHWNDLKQEARGCSLLVNATPLGMHGMDADFKDFSFLDSLNTGAVVYDLIYMPRETRLLREAGSKGFQTINGLDHLYCQAALSFAIFTGETPPQYVIQERAWIYDRP